MPTEINIEKDSSEVLFTNVQQRPNICSDATKELKGKKALNILPENVDLLIFFHCTEELLIAYTLPISSYK